MFSPTTKTSVRKPNQKFEGHTSFVRGVIHLPGGQRIITCSLDGSLQVWNLKSGKQIGEDWRDGEGKVVSIALSLDGKKVVSGSNDGAVRLWDIDTCKVIAKWTGHTDYVMSVCWSRDGQNVLSGSSDGTARQWDVESGETVLELRHQDVWATVYSPDTTLIATAGGGQGVPGTGKPEYSIQIWDAKTGKLVTILKGHTSVVFGLAWTKDTLISASLDYSIRTWNTTKWEQTAVLVEDTGGPFAIAISPNNRILASASYDKTARLWNLDNGQPITSPLQHPDPVICISFSVDGKQLATGCMGISVYSWDIAAIVKEAGLEDLISDPKANKSALHFDATQRPVQRHLPAYRVTQGFFDGVLAGPSRFSGPHSLESQGGTLLRRLFNRSPSNTQDTSPSSPLDWAGNLLKRRRQSGEGIELQGCSPAVAEVPYAQGKRRNASAREVAFAKQKRKMKASHSKNSTADSSQPHKPNIAQPSSQPQAAISNSSTTPAVGDNTAATTSAPSRPDVVLRQAGLWTRFWLFIGCLSPEYQDSRH